jgi:1-acyl-sn-glycerol-3-phosphate acyltransferase
LTQAWRENLPAEAPMTRADKLRAFVRGVPMAIVTFGCLGLLLLVRLVERPLFGVHRPWTPYITQFVCKTNLRLMGLKMTIRGKPMKVRGAEVANHASWLDIFVLNAASRIYFVSKAEVARWPGIGWLARATGTVFIRRDRREAAAQAKLFEERLAAGHRLLFFPEGTSTDSRRILPFNPTLFAAFFAEGLRDLIAIQPVTVIYTPPEGGAPEFYGWWAQMDFAPHLVKVLARRRQGSVEVIYHPHLKVADFTDRKALAAACEASIRDAHPHGSVAAN